MAQKDDIVCIVRDDNFVYVYTCEKYAREKYNELLKYYKLHKQPTDSDKWIYDVWHTSDSFACIDAKADWREKSFSISIQEQRIIK